MNCWVCYPPQCTFLPLSCSVSEAQGACARRKCSTWKGSTRASVTLILYEVICRESARNFQRLPPISEIFWNRSVKCWHSGTWFERTVAALWRASLSGQCFIAQCSERRAQLLRSSLPARGAQSRGSVHWRPLHAVLVLKAEVMKGLFSTPPGSCSCALSTLFE